MITCDQIKSLCIPYLNGKLNNAIANQVEKHLEICPLCRMELKFDQKIYRAIISDDDIPTISPDFNAVVVDRALELKKSLRRKFTIIISEHPWSVSVIGISTSIFFFIVSSIWNISNYFNDIVTFLYSLAPFLIALILLVSFWIYYVNEKFIEKLKYLSDNRNLDK